MYRLCKKVFYVEFHNHQLSVRFHLESQYAPWLNDARVMQPVICDGRVDNKGPDVLLPIHVLDIIQAPCVNARNGSGQMFRLECQLLVVDRTWFYYTLKIKRSNSF